MHRTSFSYFLIQRCLVVLLAISVFPSAAQVGNIKINGEVYDKESKLPLAKLMVINKRTSNGIFADAEGKFSIMARKTDTILLSALGFHVKTICLKDSADRAQYNVFIPLEKLSFTLKEVSVFAPRTLREIDEEISSLDSSRSTAHYSNINAMESPISYLYERFSKFGKSKQKVAEWENEDRKKDILKELFRLYVKNEIMDLSEEEFDAFIKYCNLSEYFIKNATQFELVMAIKGKYESFKSRWR